MKWWMYGNTLEWKNEMLWKWSQSVVVNEEIERGKPQAEFNNVGDDNKLVAME